MKLSTLSLLSLGVLIMIGCRQEPDKSKLIPTDPLPGKLNTSFQYYFTESGGGKFLISFGANSKANCEEYTYKGQTYRAVDLLEGNLTCTTIIASNDQDIEEQLRIDSLKRRYRASSKGYRVGAKGSKFTVAVNSDTVKVVCVLPQVYLWSDYSSAGSDLKWLSAGDSVSATKPQTVP